MRKVHDPPQPQQEFLDAPGKLSLVWLLSSGSVHRL